MKIYVTTMYRYGNRESHSYVIHAGLKKQESINAGVIESAYRGGKYDPEVVVFDGRIKPDRKIVCSDLEDSTAKKCGDK